MTIFAVPETKHRHGGLKAAMGLFAPVASAGEIVADLQPLWFPYNESVKDESILAESRRKPFGKDLTEVTPVRNTGPRESNDAAQAEVPPRPTDLELPEVPTPKHVGEPSVEPETETPYRPRHADLLETPAVALVPEPFDDVPLFPALHPPLPPVLTLVQPALQPPALQPTADLFADHTVTTEDQPDLPIRHLAPNEPIFLARLNIALPAVDGQAEDPDAQREREDIIRHRIAALLNLQTFGDITAPWDQKLIDGTIKVANRTYVVTLFRDGFEFTTAMIHPTSTAETPKTMSTAIAKVAEAFQSSGVLVSSIETQPHHPKKEAI